MLPLLLKAFQVHGETFGNLLKKWGLTPNDCYFPENFSAQIRSAILMCAGISLAHFS